MITRRTALQLLAVLPAGQINMELKPQDRKVWMQPIGLLVRLNFAFIEIERNGEKVRVDQDELFAALKATPEAGRLR